MKSKSYENTDSKRLGCTRCILIYFEKKNICEQNNFSIYIYVYHLTAPFDIVLYKLQQQNILYI